MRFFRHQINDHLDGHMVAGAEGGAARRKDDPHHACHLDFLQPRERMGKEVTPDYAQEG